jgi:predicted phage terminase large subunit-like protein
MSATRKQLELKARAKKELEKRLYRKRCEEDFSFFVRQAWPSIEPAQPLMWGKAMEMVCRHMEALDAREITRLIVNIPPGMSKSTIAGVMFPAWIFAREPTAKILSVAHNLDLALRDSVRCRRLVTSEWYQDLWPHIKLSADQNAKAKFEIEGYGGFRQALASGAITGVRADHVICLPYNSMIYTSCGVLPIGDIVEHKLDVDIAGMGSKGLIWQKIEKYERNPVRQIYRIKSGQSVLECTEDHRIFVKNRGWIAASEVVAGDYIYASDNRALRALRDNHSSAQKEEKGRAAKEILWPEMLLRVQEKGIKADKQPAVPDLRDAGLQVSSASPKNEGWTFLREPVCREIQDGGEQSCLGWRKPRAYLSKVWGEVLSHQLGEQTSKILLWHMRQIVRVGRARPDTGDFLRGVREIIQAAKSLCENMLSEVWGQVAFSANFWVGERPLHSWAGGASISSRVDTQLQAGNSGERQKRLFGMWRCVGGGEGNLSRSPHRLQQGKSEPVEPYNSLSSLPWENARQIGEESGVNEQIVESVEAINSDITCTYNIRVSDAHNYFAEGILVHNCDDPLSATDAMSEAVRNSMKDWILEAVPTRLNNPGGERPSTISLIMQRLHEDDTTGVLIDKNLGYEHLMLPMEYDPARHCSTSVGEDWRTEEGELLFPERFPLEVVERDKKAMGPWASASQLQQSPSPRGGGLIKRDQFMLYDDALAQEQGKPDASKYPDLDVIIASVDTAYTTKQENDASAITVWGIWQKGGAAARSLISSYADNSNVYDMSGKRISMVDERDTIPCAMLMYAKELFVPLHGDEVPRMEGESPEAYRRRAESKWGLCEHITDICKRFNVDTILIEAKASGISVAQEIKRLNKLASWQVKLVNPGNLDKVARVYSIQPIFSNGQVYCPEKDWADKVISQCETFPKARRDDLVDTVSQALRYLRDNGFLARADEVGARIAGEYQIGGGKKKQWIYDV